VRRFANGVTMIREPHHREDVKSYLIEGSRDVAVLDTGTGAGDFAGLVASLSSRRPRVLQTHADWDHIGASFRFDDVRVHPSEAERLRAGYAADRFMAEFSPESVDPALLPTDFDPGSGIPGLRADGMARAWRPHRSRRARAGGLSYPGHSPGGVSFLDRDARAFFVGDLLYLGRCSCSFRAATRRFRDSLRLAAEIAATVDTIYPAHDSVPLDTRDALRHSRCVRDVWAGRAPDATNVLRLSLRNHEFGRFSFNMPPRLTRRDCTYTLRIVYSSHGPAAPHSVGRRFFWSGATGSGARSRSA
jgi:glyoxylase-like metal-dependent hydrolase (beta-lactamase superfamily II)